MPIGGSTARSGRTSSGAINALTGIAFRRWPRISVKSGAGIPGRRNARVWHRGCFDRPRWVDPMGFRPFTSESYAEGDRPEAWRDVLAAVGLQPAAAGAFYDGHATAFHR